MGIRNSVPGKARLRRPREPPQARQRAPLGTYQGQSKLSDQPLLPYTYALLKVPVQTYRSVEDAINGGSPRRIFSAGNVWVSVHGRVEAGGKVFYRINPDEYVEASYLSFSVPSIFRGIALATSPSRPFGWIIQNTQPVEEPGQSPRPDAPVLKRYTLIEVEEIRSVGNQKWYRVSPNQWVMEQTAGLVYPTSPPEGVPSGAKWIEVNLREQTLAAYEGDRMVYATLISSGRARTPTVTGLFQIRIKARTARMDGNIFGYYYLEDVPWTMFFYERYALHGVYWHDQFGFPQSRGCVNLSPIDARWLFEWAEPRGDRPFVQATPERPGTWVWIHP